MSKVAVWGYSLLSVLSNSAIAPTSRVIYSQKAFGTSDDAHAFVKPFFLEFLMFVGMSLCMLLELASRVRQRCRARIPRFKRSVNGVGVEYSPLSTIAEEEEDELDDDDDGVAAARHKHKHRPSLKRGIFLMGLVSLADFIGSLCEFGGQIWVEASINMMFYAWNTIFTALLSRLILNKSILRHQFVGIFILVVGVVLCGVAQMQAISGATPSSSSSSSPFLTAVGIGLLVVGHFFYALESVLSEKYISSFHVSTYFLVGVFGMWGVSFFLVVVFPVIAFTPVGDTPAHVLWHEDTLDTLAMLGQSPLLVGLCVLLCVSLFAFNLSWFKVVELVSALHVVMLACLVPPIVWTIDLTLTYAFHSPVGAAEVWTPWSWLELGGSLLIVAGNLWFNDVRPAFTR